MNNKIKNSILASFVADTYALGAHWIYDALELKNLAIDWNDLNKAHVSWHEGKMRGDFTHYGDQSFFLLEYLYTNKTFDKLDYYAFWSDKMQSYNGYIDGATKNALTKIDSSSNDLSICARMAPLLLIAKDKKSFMSDVDSLVKITHNTSLAHDVSQFFAELLWDTKENNNLRDNLASLKDKYTALSHLIDEASQSKNTDTLECMQKFGISCEINESFLGVIHLLYLDEDFKSIMIINAKAGGDSSARAMIVAMLLALDENCQIPSDWLQGMNKVQDIKKYLEI